MPTNPSIIAEPSVSNNFLFHHIRLLVSNFKKYTKEDFPISASGIKKLADKTYNSNEFVLLSHNTREDPMFNYANRKAQKLWGYNWTEFVGIESKRSAEIGEQGERAKFLKAVSDHGFVMNYKGVRIANNGTRFRIKDVIVWNINSDDGNYYGQAALFSNWEFL